MGALYQPAPQEERNWRPIIVGFVVIAVVIGVVWALYRKSSSGPRPPGFDPYVSNLQLSDLHLSKATNFVGGEVTYVEGKISNLGAQTVVGTQVEIVFRNSLGEIVQKETQPLRVAQVQLGQPDYVASVRLSR